MVMRARLLSVCLLLLVPGPAAADTLVSFGPGTVTWVASGVTTDGYASLPGLLFPPVGTPWALTLTFNPSASFPTIGRLPHQTYCNSVNVAGSLDIGGYAYAGTGFGFTHAQLPGTNCVDGGDNGDTQFGFGLAPLGDSPWDVNGSFFVASYRDELVRDAFPETPTGEGFWSWRSPFLFEPFWEVSAPFDPALKSVEQPTPVPEPGTVSLFGLGLAAAARHLRKKR